MRNVVECQCLLVGTAFWIIMHEIMAPALGVTRGPAACSRETHAREFAGHVMFGTVANATLAAAQPAA